MFMTRSPSTRWRMFLETSTTCWKLQLWLHVVGFNLFMATHNNVNAAKPILYGYINICTVLSCLQKQVLNNSQS